MARRSYEKDKWVCKPSRLMCQTGIDEDVVQGFVENNIMPLLHSLLAAGEAGQPCTSEADIDLLRQACNIGLPLRLCRLHDLYLASYQIWNKHFAI